MNERLKQLAEQAGMYIVDDEFSTYGKFAETFAELIVQECIDIAQDRAAFDGFPPNDVNHIIDEIKAHFGVEE
jgi:uncharacterized protein YutE (UPF0331/DUF86 family)